LGPEFESSPLALVANGTFPQSGAGRARIQRTIPVAAESVDLTYAVSFGMLPSEVSFDVGCTLELSRSDQTSARARVSDWNTGTPAVSGLVASGDVTHAGAREARVPPPPPRTLSDQLATAAWYTIHIGATVDPAGAHFSFDVQSAAAVTDAHLDPIAVPFAAP